MYGRIARQKLLFGNGAPLIKTPSHWVRPAIESGNIDSPEIRNDPEPPRETAEAGSPQIAIEYTRSSSDGEIDSESSSIARVPDFAPRGKYNLRPHTQCVSVCVCVCVRVCVCGIRWVWKIY